MDNLCKQLTTNNKLICSLIKDYNSDDWKDIVKNIKKEECNRNNYHKILVFKGDDFEVFLIIWFDGAESPIHDHPMCIVKILEGTLIEDIYENIDSKQAKYIETNILNKDDINYKNGNKILHSIKCNHYAVSLHIYYPPNYIQNIYYK